MKRSKHKKPFTTRQQAAILRLYVQQCLPFMETAKRLRMDEYRVRTFLRCQGLMRPRGSGHNGHEKLSSRDRQNLEGELATTMDVVLARKYGVSRERIRQIRRQLGCPSSRVLRRAWAARARAKRREQGILARALWQQQRRAKRLLAVNRLSKRWKSGVLVAELAQELGYTIAYVHVYIGKLRKQFPEKFPYRCQPRSPRRLQDVR